MDSEALHPNTEAFNARLEAQIAALEREASRLADPAAADRLRALAQDLRRSLIEDSGHCCCEEEVRRATG